MPSLSTVSAVNWTRERRSGGLTSSSARAVIVTLFVSSVSVASFVFELLLLAISEQWSISWFWLINKKLVFIRLNGAKQGSSKLVVCEL